MSAKDFEEGYASGAREVLEDRWTKKMAADYLSEVGAPREDFDRGHQQAIREISKLAPVQDLGWTLALLKREGLYR